MLVCVSQTHTRAGIYSYTVTCMHYVGTVAMHANKCVMSV